MEKNVKIQAVVRTLKSLNYKIFTRPFELNIVGYRSKSTIPNLFDDKIVVFWYDKNGKIDGRIYAATTDPGTFWLKNPMTPQGTAILKAGQYIDTYALDLHKGDYLALTQKKPVTVIRDYDRNAVLDFNNGKEEKGNFGINLHRAKKVGTTVSVDKNSAGCQVLANGKDFDELIALAQKHKALYGNKFTYTLIDNRAYARRMKKIIVGVGTILLAVASIYAIYQAVHNKPILPKL